MSASLRELVLARAADTRPGLVRSTTSPDGTTSVRSDTWAEVVHGSAVRAAALRSLMDPSRPAHVGTLLGNTDEMLLAITAASLGGHVCVGLNTTRRGAALATDTATADVQVLLTDAAGVELLGGVELPGVHLVRVDTPAWAALLEEHADASLPSTPSDPDDLVMLIFTSGTSGRPKAVKVTDAKIAGPAAMLGERFGLGPDDVAYLSMPLFHSNAVMAGFGPALWGGATLAVAPFSASGFLGDVRRFGATYANYVGKPLAYVLATPEQDDDAENPLRLLFGNEANERDIAEFGRRFGCMVVDSYSSTENAVIVRREPGMPAGALGRPAEGVAVLDPETLQETPDAVFDADGRLANATEATGEIVNTAGRGAFAGYYNDPAAEDERMRAGMYWSGDLAYRDADGWIYFAGRTSDWLRVDGENIAAAPVERVLLRHPDIGEAYVYAVPDPRSGDQVVAALVTTGPLDPAGFEAFLDAQADLSPKARPRFVLLDADLPRTATNKVLKRELTLRGSDAAAWEREERGTAYRVR